MKLPTSTEKRELMKEIKLKIHEEDDLYSPYDPDKKLLAEEVVTHLMRNFIHKHRSLKEEYLLHIITDTPVDEERVRENIRSFFIQEMDDADYALKRLTFKEIGLGAVGVFFLLVWLYVSSKASDLKLEILSIMGWVGIWEATDIMIMERPELVMARKNIKNLLDAEIVIERLYIP